MRDIKEKAIADGTFMKAPNGNPTNLTERQWLQVRTKAFKDWFGDWINDPANASKVVDENGEPLVVHHGTDIEWNTFDASFNIRKKYGTGLYTTTKDSSRHGTLQMDLFLNIKNPIINDVLTDDKTKEGYDGVLIKHDNSSRLGDWYVAPTANQIKSATDNVGTFSKEDNNIYHSSITEEVSILYPSFMDFAYMSDNPSEVLKAALNGEINIRCK